MKWIPLSIFAAVFGGLGWLCMGFGWSIPGAVLGVTALVLGITALSEYAVKYADDFSIIFERRQRAKYTSPVVMIAESLKGLHPENTRLLSRFTARAVWDMKVNMETRERDVMIRGTNIHLGFVEHVLNNSKNGQLYGRNKFGEGACEWDPYKQVTDRAQHQEFELWLATRLIVARHYDNAAAVFLPPWTPELVKEAMGIADQIEFYSPKPNVAVKSLPVEKVPAKAAVEAAHPVATLTDEEMENIRNLQAAHDRKYSMTVEQYVNLNKK